MAQALKSSTADIKLGESNERLKKKSVVDHMASVLAKAETNAGPKARARLTESRKAPSTKKTAPGVAAAKSKAQADIRYIMQTSRDLFEMPPSMRGYHDNMQHVLASSGLPLFPGYHSLDGARLATERSTDASSLILRMRLVDYLNANLNSALWASLESWAQGIGFDVFRDHSASQIGVACGIVAARVVTWLKESRNFMEHDTSAAVSSDVLRIANTGVLCLLSVNQNGGIPPAQYDECCRPGADGVVPATAVQTYELSDDDTGHVATYFHGSVARDYGTRDGERHGFVIISTIDETIRIIAQAVFKASTGDASAYGKIYFITNDQPTGKPGYHWATIVISIEPRDEPVAFETVANNSGARNQNTGEAPGRRATKTRLSFSAENSF